MNGPEVILYPCTFCGQEFENRNSMANHVRWTHKEKKFSDEGYANLKRTGFKQVNERKLRLRGCAITVFRPCPKCKLIFKVDGFSKRMSRMKRFCSQKCANSKDWANHPDGERIKESRRKSVLERPNGPWGEKSQDYKGRFSSRAERSLAKALGQDFSRHSLVRSDHLNFDVDIVSKDGRVWIESDGPYHFGKVHRNHDFEKSRQRDEIEEQARFVWETISSWGGSPCIMKHY